MPLAGARHLDCLYRWLDWTLSPRIEGQIARRLGGVAADRPVDWTNVLPWRTPQHACGDGRGSTCADWADWSDAWAALRSD
jgi:putative spermidine/putrescine transport system substrate-binding protein